MRRETPRRSLLECLPQIVLAFADLREVGEDFLHLLGREAFGDGGCALERLGKASGVIEQRGVDAVMRRRRLRSLGRLWLLDIFKAASIDFSPLRTASMTSGAASFLTFLALL